MGRKPRLPEAADFFAQNRGKKGKAPNGKTVLPQSRATAELAELASGDIEGGPAHTVDAGVTEKVTFYVSPELLKRLELTRVQLLLDYNLKVSRSQVVEIILRRLVGEVEEIADLLAKMTDD